MGGDLRSGRRFPIKETVSRYRQVVSNGVRTLLHRERAEKALGRSLPAGVVVHHADGSKRDDAPLVICQDEQYHKLLHRRMRVLNAGGDPDAEKVCSRCRAVKAFALFGLNRAQCDGLNQYCRECDKAYKAARLGVSLGLV
jgi:hypothetical protein